MTLHNDGPLGVTPDREIDCQDVVPGMVIRLQGQHGYSDDVYLVVADAGEYDHVDKRAFSLIDGWESVMSHKVLDVTGSVRLHTMKSGGR